MTQTVTSKAARNQLLRPIGIGVQLNQPITQHVTGHQDNNIIYQLKKNLEPASYKVGYFIPKKSSLFKPKHILNNQKI